MVFHRSHGFARAARISQPSQPLRSHATVPALFSVGLMDPLCPPSTVCAAFNHWAHPDKSVWEFNGHEGGGAHHLPDRSASSPVSRAGVPLPGDPAAGRGAGPGRHLW